MMKLPKLVATGFLVFAGCDSRMEESPAVPLKARPVGEPNPSSSEKTDGSTDRSIGGMKFEIPSDWEEKPLQSTVLLAEFSLPGKSGPARLTLSTARGGTEMNLDRWRDQVRRGDGDAEPKETRITAAGKVATLIELQGSFQDTFQKKGLQPNWQLTGVAIPLQADLDYFIKLTGPRETLAARREEFLKFVETARLE